MHHNEWAQKTVPITKKFPTFHCPSYRGRKLPATKILSNPIETSSSQQSKANACNYNYNSWAPKTVPTVGNLQTTLSPSRTKQVKRNHSLIPLLTQLTRPLYPCRSPSIHALQTQLPLPLSKIARTSTRFATIVQHYVAQDSTIFRRYIKPRCQLCDTVPPPLGEEAPPSWRKKDD